MMRLRYVGILSVILGLTYFMMFQRRSGSGSRIDDGEKEVIASLSGRAKAGMAGRNRPVEDTELDLESNGGVFELGNALIKYLEKTGNYDEVLAALENVDGQDVEMLMRNFIFGVDSGYGVDGDLEKQLELASDLGKNEPEFLGRALMAFGEKRGKEEIAGGAFENLLPIHQLNLVTGMTRGGTPEAIVGTLNALPGEAREDIQDRIVALMMITNPVEFVGFIDRFESGPFKDSLLVTVVRGLKQKSANEEAKEWLGEIADVKTREELRRELNIGE